MPPKNFTCNVCSKEVSKRKSYVVNEETGERACRTHEETQTALKIKETKEKIRRLESEKADLQKKIARKRAEEAQSEEFWQQARKRLHCQICGINGIREDEFNRRLLIAINKVEIKYGSYNIFEDNNKIRELFLAPGDDRNIVCLKFFPCGKDNKHQRYLFSQVRYPADATFEVKERVRTDKTCISLLGQILLCPDCEKRHRAKRAEVDLMAPGVLENASLSLAIIEPAIQAIAFNEVAKTATT